MSSSSAVVAIPKMISLRDLFSSEIEFGLETRPDIEKKIGPQIREKTEAGGAATKSHMRKF